MERFRTHDGIELAYDEMRAPDGPPVVLCHGFAADTRAMVSFLDEHAE